MQLAIITPIKMLEPIQHEFMPTYHLVLTQYYLKSDTYRAFYLKRRSFGDFLILDNGAAEVKEGLTSEDVMRVARELRPNLVVAPDNIYQKDETLDRTAIFITLYADELHKQGTGIMAVPQGANPREWRQCFLAFNRMPEISWLGISMFYAPKFNGRRFNVLSAIEAEVRKPCHLLGLWNNPQDLLAEKAFPFVKGIDTAKAIEFASEGLRLSEWKHHKHIDDDYFFHEYEPDIDDDKLIRWNINHMRQIVS